MCKGACDSHCYHRYHQPQSQWNDRCIQIETCTLHVMNKYHMAWYQCGLHHPIHSEPTTWQRCSKCSLCYDSGGLSTKYHWIYLIFSQIDWGGWGCEFFFCLWWAPSAKRKDHHGVISEWCSVWYRSNTGLSSTQYEQVPIILGVWLLWLTPFFFRSVTFWRWI